MIWLAVFWVINLIEKLVNQSISAAIISSILLALVQYASWRYGGWSSLAHALEWLRKQRQMSVPIVAGPVAVFLLAVATQKSSLPTAIVECLWIYFFFHGCTALWVRFVRKSS